MGIDAVALLRPKRKALLRKKADHLMPLDDGSVLFLTLMRYRDFEADPASARAYLEAELGCALEKVQDDERGVLMFADVAEPSATTYDGVVAEMEADGDGFWVPLDDTREAGRYAARAAAKKEARIEKRGLKGLFPPFGVPDAIPTDAPLFSGDVTQLEQLAGSYVRIAPDAEVWCLLVRRKTPLASRPLATMTKEVVVLADKSAAIRAKYLEGIDSVSARLSGEYATWIAEHDDPRGVPVFRMGMFHRVKDATSYADAVIRLGDDVRWVVPKVRVEDVDERRMVRVVKDTRPTAAKKKTPKKSKARNR